MVGVCDWVGSTMRKRSSSLSGAQSDATVRGERRTLTTGNSTDNRKIREVPRDDESYRYADQYIWHRPLCPRQ